MMYALRHIYRHIHEKKNRKHIWCLEVEKKLCNVDNIKAGIVIIIENMK